MVEHNLTNLPSPGDRLAVAGELVEVVGVGRQGEDHVELVIRRSGGELETRRFERRGLARAVAPASDGKGASAPALTSLWGHWMAQAIPRIRSAVLATRPLRPYAHQDDAVANHLLPQPRLRFLLADEPGTGKTIMAGMYLVEGRRRALIPHRTLIVVPAHLIPKWRRDMRRFFGIEAEPLTTEVGQNPRPLRPDADVWVVSLDLLTRNEGVRAKVLDTAVTWSLVVFDEAHRLTPSSTYLPAAQELARRTHHLLLLTATPHRGNEYFFRALLNLLDPDWYLWDPGAKQIEERLRPGRLHFLRRMKEGLRDNEGNDLFPPRSSLTEPIALTGAEDDAYKEVMDYVDTWYPDTSTLARSVYGKRAASSLVAARATMRRRREALTAGGVRIPSLAPDLTSPDVDIDDPELWEDAEQAVVSARSVDRRGEVAAIDRVIDSLEVALADPTPPAKWTRVEEILQRHEIRPDSSGNQLLVFSEYVDTAVWLLSLFQQAGFSAEVLTGDDDHEARDRLQRRFLRREFQVLVSTDAGGEGIDLQSANVMVNWDIPWSLVRLEQRMGRLHRIGQTRPVYTYQLVAPGTREGRVQEVMLRNFEAAADALGGLIFDLMNATAERLGFDYRRTLLAAQRSMAEIPLPRVPGTDELVSHAREIYEEERRLSSHTDLDRAAERLAQDRLEAINPHIVEAFLRQVVSAKGWAMRAGPAPGVYVLEGSDLPQEVTQGRRRLVAVESTAVERARDEGAEIGDVAVLGPAEPEFRALAELAQRAFAAHLLRGAVLADRGSLTDYFLFCFSSTIEGHDGMRPTSEPYHFLIRYSGEGAFPVAWELLMNLEDAAVPGSPPPPGVRAEADDAAREEASRERARVRNERAGWVDEAHRQLEEVENRYFQQIADRSLQERRRLRATFEVHKRARTDELSEMEKVEITDPRLVGWVRVLGTARADELGFDPNSERVAIATVLGELERQGFTVDDRQTAGVGYDLYARRPAGREQRLVEVKGLAGGLEAIALEQSEWVQALQRGVEYWLYVVVDCASEPRIFVRVQDPAGQLLAGPREVKRFMVPVGELRRLAGEEP